MKHLTLLALATVCLTGSPTAAFDNSFSVVLNGFSQEVVASDDYGGVLGTNARTISWWYRSHVNSFPPVWGVVFWGQMWSVQLESFDGGGIACECGGTKIAWTGNKNPTMASLQNGQWHQMVMTAPGNGNFGDIELYLDGELLPVVAVRGGSLTRAYDTSPGGSFRVGARDLGNHADADIDEVALWDVELSAAEVTEIFNGGVPTDLTQNGSSYTNAGRLQLYWRFEEGAGLATSDVSGNGHGGLLVDGNSIDSWGTNPPGSGSDSDGDGILDAFDNCPDDPNPGQEDLDLDRIGDVCDVFPDNPDNDQAQCEADLQQALGELDLCLNPPVPPTQCSDGVDNDGDGWIDLEDRQCLSADQDSEKNRNR
jgi:hypothetical protein